MPADVLTLDLNGARVTDAGLKELAGLKQLWTLDLAFTKVTDAEVAELQKALPGCHISASGEADGGGGPGPRPRRPADGPGPGSPSWRVPR